MQGMTKREHLFETSKTPRLRDLVIAVKFLSIFSNERQKVPPINHKHKCLID